MTRAELVSFVPVTGTPLNRTLADACNLASRALSDGAADEIVLRGTLREIRSVLRTALTYEGMAR